MHQQYRHLIFLALSYCYLNWCCIVQVPDNMQYLHDQKGITISEPVIVLIISSRSAVFTFPRRFFIPLLSNDVLSASKAQFSIDSTSNSFVEEVTLINSGFI